MPPGTITGKSDPELRLNGADTLTGTVTADVNVVFVPAALNGTVPDFAFAAKVSVNDAGAAVVATALEGLIDTPVGSDPGVMVTTPWKLGSTLVKGIATVAVKPANPVAEALPTLKGAPSVSPPEASTCAIPAVPLKLT